AISTTASDMFSVVLRSVSFTIRLRLTPAMACSTRTRICANFRLTRFSRSVSGCRFVFFFRLASSCHRGLIALKPCILVQGHLGRKRDGLLIDDLLLVYGPGVGGTQVQHAPARRVDHEHVLVGMCLLLPAVAEGLFFRVFRPLAPPFRGIEDELLRLPGAPRLAGSPLAIPFREN